MHIHTQSAATNAAALPSPVALEKADTLRRATDVRRRLSDSARSIHAHDSSDDTWSLDDWNENARQQRDSPYERTAVRGGSSASEKSSPPPFSLWA